MSVGWGDIEETITFLRVVVQRPQRYPTKSENGMRAVIHRGGTQPTANACSLCVPEETNPVCWGLEL